MLRLKNRNNSLNLIRLILASFVLIYHSYFFLGFETNNYAYILRLAVPCFFVISGYLIISSAIKNDVKSYFKKRFARIYPAFLCSIIMTMILFAPLTFSINNSGTFDIISFLKDSDLIKFFIYSLPFGFQNLGTTLINTPATTWNGSAWTLKYEFGCYIVIAIIILLLNKLKILKKNYVKIIFGLYILLTILSILDFAINGKYNDNYFNKHLYTYAIYFLSIFLGGSTVYLISENLQTSWKILSIMLIFCFIIMRFMPYFIAMEICAIPMIYILLFISVKLKSPRWIQENDISYGIYIYAWPIQVVVACFWNTHSIPHNLLIYSFICMILTIIFATISWFLIEKPILDKIRG
ncbi:acyltransferase family protein [Methanobrevibacter millerae]|uniref:Peptidoglycan/LPS O-acetylase OafA/YrhL, contains acyltransferase and SGNH-hydrolase domains n=1 Tax=Methanobrevibacter millerae TaxID=230361 RepID=A0A1G5WWB7_9EURY|nr:acyltransferase [Methanobrevibacter millerae]SDA62488.1 Peptidoglycan/LPS O-acetylase OafA/YrhL, contains acyltransferase and SGNH-hydrolase domains [Methanobrevibacter millerae]